MLFNKVPGICLCVGIKEMFAAAFLAYHPLLSTSGSSAGSMIVALNLCGQYMDLQLPYATLSKHRAGLMASIKQK